MFQYAAGRSLSARHNTSLMLDLTWYEKNWDYHAKRTYDLHVFNITADIASESEVRRFKHDLGHITLSNAPFFVLHKLGVYKSHQFVERSPLEVDRDFFSQPDNTYLVGYWGHEAYFKSIQDVIRREFTLKQEVVISDIGKQLAHRMNVETSVSLHIRRGDYLTDQHRAESLIYTLPIDYYQSALQHLSSSIGEDFRVYVFSDDPAWVAQELPDLIDVPFISVSHNGPDRAYEDLWLMSQCKHHIIANSTFSWWGAWLNHNPQKIVIAPKQWYKPQMHLEITLPDGWIRLWCD